MDHEPEFRPGDVVAGSDFKIVKVLGAGGMGTVYEVEDISVGRRFVLKTLHLRLLDRKDIIARFQREARTLAQLNHPNIVEVITFKWTADTKRRCYFVMEKLNGRTLRHLLRGRGSLELKTVYGMAVDLFDAIDHAHDNNVIHRDIKPENIFIHKTRDGQWIAKLLDFGVMKLLQGESDTAGRFLGTLKYAAPEQFDGWGAVKASDLYAAGLVLYEMITGQSPFEDARSEPELTQAQAKRVPPRLSQVAPYPIPFELDELVASLLAKKAADRPGSALEVALRLRELQQEALGSEGMAGHAGVTVPDMIIPSHIPVDTPSQPAVERGASSTTSPMAMEVPPPSSSRTPVEARGGQSAPSHTVERSAETRTGPVLGPHPLPPVGKNGTEPLPVDEIFLPPVRRPSPTAPAPETASLAKVNVPAAAPPASPPRERGVTRPPRAKPARPGLAQRLLQAKHAGEVIFAMFVSLGAVVAFLMVRRPPPPLVETPVEHAATAVEVAPVVRAVAIGAAPAPSAERAPPGDAGTSIAGRRRAAP